MLIKINDNWEFSLDNTDNFSPVLLPHDWLIADVNNLYKSGVGYYRRKLDCSQLSGEKRVIIRFDGVYMDSSLYVNGSLAGEWKYGWTAFFFDITQFLSISSNNTLLLKVNYQAPSARWYTGAGIYRDVYLDIRESCHFKQDGIYITTKRTDSSWSYSVDCDVETAGQPYELCHTLLGNEEIRQWDIEAPHMYTLRSELIIDGRVTDTQYTRFGFREISFTPDGFYLNGRRMKLNGVCLHSDSGALGAAVYPDVIRRQFTKLKGMGVNALRTAHNPPARAFMELACEMGFLVMSELLDTWRRPKNPYDYSRFFDEWIERDVAAWVRRDRNHPSLILWSIGNEIYDTHEDAKEGGRTLKRLCELVRMHDPNKHAPITFSSNYMQWENTQICADMLGIVGYNYAEPLYEAHHLTHPDWVIFGGETCSTVQSRGIYHFPLSKSTLADDDLQCSALGNSSTSWGAKSVEECMKADPVYSAGQFLWAGQDYLGEPTPYHTKNAYFGHIDTAGFEKDSFYIVKAAWTDAPMIHLYPYWDFSPGQMIDVRAATNCPYAELFLNGKSMGMVRADLAANWRIEYFPGVLRAVAYDENHCAVAEDERCSFGEAAHIKMTSEIYDELCFVTITAVDEQGNPVDNANRRVMVTVENGELLALDNGDSTDYEQYNTDNRRMFSGKLLAIVKRLGGRIPEVKAEFLESDIPVRKIELTRDGLRIYAKVLPDNATYYDYVWRLTDAGGIDSPLGSLTPAKDGLSALINPKGDGEVWVRFAVHNGREHAALISQLPFNLSGYGNPYIDPYTFVCGGLYTKSNRELTNGNERGIATPRDGESYVLFDGLNFGSFGADEVTFKLFPLSNDPVWFEIWENMPSEGGRFICSAVYDKGMCWNTYREVTVKLPHRLCGVTALCTVFRQKVHIGGFWFNRLNKAYEKLSATENDGIYGDTFEPCGECVVNIGNNVTIIYKDMDFCGNGAEKIEICWRSKLKRNSVQIVFTGLGCEQKAMIELAETKDYEVSTFILGTRFYGQGKVSLVFLPGTHMDLGWIRFS